MTTSTRSASRSMDAARHRDRELADAYEAGRSGEVTFDEIRDHRADPDDPHQRALHDSYQQGAADRRADRRIDRARAVGRTGKRTGSYLARAGRSVASHADDIPTSSGGTFLGILVGVVALILLYVALSRAGAVASVFSGLSKAAQWLIAPKPLPI